jgi:hypothetical protein
MLPGRRDGWRYMPDRQYATTSYIDTRPGVNDRFGSLAEIIAQEAEAAACEGESESHRFITRAPSVVLSSHRLKRRKSRCRSSAGAGR